MGCQTLLEPRSSPTALAKGSLRGGAGAPPGSESSLPPASLGGAGGLTLSARGPARGATQTKGAWQPFVWRALSFEALPESALSRTL